MQGRLRGSAVRSRGAHLIAPLPTIEPVRRPSTLRVEHIADSAVGRHVVAGGVGSFEPETLSILLALVEVEGLTRYLDVGANVGFFPVVLKAIHGERVEVRGYEPLPSLAETARTFARANDLEVDIRQQALSDEAGTGTLFVSAVSDSSNSLNPNFRKAKDTVEVELLTLDTLAADFPTKLIKIDTESTEPDVLRGGDAFIAEHRPWIICEVLKNRTEAALSAFVERHGYHCYHLDERPLVLADELAGDPSYEHRDWLLAPHPVTPELDRRYLEWVAACGRAASRR